MFENGDGIWNSILSEDKHFSTHHHSPWCSYPDSFNGRCEDMSLLDELKLNYVTLSEREDLKKKVREMFYFGFDNYIKHAFPMDELNPIFCRGRGSDKDNPGNININDALGDYVLTLVDSLDTIAVIGDVDQFQNAVQLIVSNLKFDSTTVQIFESTIRVLGGLLSGHIIMTHPNRIKLFGADFRPPSYDDELLNLARELGTRLLPGFSGTQTGLPWPRVNLKYGVPTNCSVETATAGAGTLLLEFGVLSKLTGDPIYESVSLKAVRKLYGLRSSATGLLGSVVNVNSGEFVNQMSGVGAGLDSFFEYLLKSHILFSSFEKNDNFIEMFDSVMSSARQYMRIGRAHCNKGHGTTPLYVNVDMKTGNTANYWIDSLQAAFPAILVLNGDVNEAICQHAIFAAIWSKYGVLPERFNYRMKKPDVSFYPLRPELAESTYVLYQATRNPYYLAVGRWIVENLNRYCKAQCGYATIHDVDTMEQEDRQESFFLAETCKYLYLLFDIENPVNVNAERIIFNTEGHILPIDYMYRGQVDDTLHYTPTNHERHNKFLSQHEKGAPYGNMTAKGTTLVDSLPVKSNSFGSITSRSCQMTNSLRNYITPLPIHYLQQIKAEVG